MKKSYGCILLRFTDFRNRYAIEEQPVIWILEIIYVQIIWRIEIKRFRVQYLTRQS